MPNKRENTNDAPHNALEARLSENEARLDAIVRTAVDGIITINESGIIQSFNQSAESIFGYFAEEIIGKNISLLMPRNDAEMHDHYITNYIETGKRNIIGIGREVIGKRKNGTTVPIELSISEFQVADRRYFAGVLRDITERNEMQALLQSERSFVSAILDTATALIIVTEPNGRIVRFNPACEKASGYSMAELEGSIFWKSLLPNNEHNTIKELFNHISTGIQSEEFECEWICKSGTHRLISWNYTALRDSKGRVENFIGTGIDVTEIRASEEENRQHQEELAHMDRISLMAEMATGLAHELNQPLTALYAYSRACLQLLANGSTDTDNLGNLLEKISKTAEKAGLIIRHLRQFTRKEKALKAPTNPNALLSEVTQLCESRFKDNNIDLQLHLNPDVPKVLINKVQIEQVILNLISNSLDAMSSSTTRKLVIALTSNSPSSIEISVCDTGFGLGNVQSNRIFDAFYSTKTDGMGMGLAISRGIVENHGGELKAGNNPEGGACFQIKLPIAPDNPA